MREVPTITSVGEVLIDFVATTAGSLAESPGFVKTVGGEAANVAVGLAKLGSHSVFIGKVGHDSFGKYLVNQLKKHRVDARGVLFDGNHRTRLAFVSLDESCERHFEFWEETPAGEQLEFSDINLETVKKSRIVNIAPLLLTKEPGRSTAFRLAREVMKCGAEIAFDANVRLALWNSVSEAKRVMLRMVRLCSILKLNNEEATFLTGISNMQRAARKLLSLGPKLVVITRGAKGCYFRTNKRRDLCPGYTVHAIDTTGCGDAFFCCAAARYSTFTTFA
ncbi:MAG: carbohydrate kinase [Bacteroidota bacterium]